MAISGVFCLCRHPALACLIGGPGCHPWARQRLRRRAWHTPSFLHRLSYPPTRLFQPPAAKCAAVLWKTLLRKGNGYGRLTLRSSPGPQTCWGGVGTARLHVVPGPGMRMSPKVPPGRTAQSSPNRGGSNGYRIRAWKIEVAQLAAEAGLAITVCHLPAGSKWTKIEPAVLPNHHDLARPASRDPPDER